MFSLGSSANRKLASLVSLSRLSLSFEDLFKRINWPLLWLLNWWEWAMLMREVGKDWDDKEVLGNTHEKHDRMRELWTENRCCSGRLWRWMYLKPRWVSSRHFWTDTGWRGCWHPIFGKDLRNHLAWGFLNIFISMTISLTLTQIPNL